MGYPQSQVFSNLIEVAFFAKTPIELS